MIGKCWIQKIIDSLYKNNQIAEWAAMLDLAKGENWQGVIEIFKKHGSFEKLSRHQVIQPVKI